MQVGNRSLESYRKVFGMMTSGGGRIEKEIRSRIRKATRVTGMLNEPVGSERN